MKEYYIIYKNNSGDSFYKYISIKAENGKEAINTFYKEHPKAEFAVMYDRNILPFLNFDNDSK